MDLAKRTDLSQADQFQIASDMHALILDEVFRGTEWKAPAAIFHGGTSLKFAWNSDRFSEDLDFMATPEAMDGLDQVMETVRNRIDRHMAAALPGSSVALVERKAKEDGLRRWDLKWTHPNRIGKVLVKVEILETPPSALKEYAARMVMPSALSPSGIRITTPIAVPELLSVWADKLKAIATRPAFKARDAYDLAFIKDRMDATRQNPSAEDAVAALKVSATIYGKTLEDVRDGLAERISAGDFDNHDAFASDMERWFDAETFERFRSSGFLGQLLRTAKEEAERAFALAQEYAADGAKP
jgi:predicted nucleotidyltransferase component of viral defense system